MYIDWATRRVHKREVLDLRMIVHNVLKGIIGAHYIICFVAPPPHLPPLNISKYEV